MEIHAVGTLCALAAATFAASRAADRRSLAVLALGFVAALLFSSPAQFPEPAAVGAVAALAAVLAIARPCWWWWSMLAAGAFAGLWVSVLRGQGLPSVPALLIAAALSATAAWLTTRRPGFAPAALREEALLLVGGFGLIVAVGADLVAGWNAAGVLTAQPLDAGGPAAGRWLSAFVLGCVSIGGLYSLWKRR